MKTLMRVVEIFDSIDGEGIRMGQPATFIRLAGCNVRCSYCDTAYALYGEKEKVIYTEMTADEIAAKVNKNYGRVTLTGGEPLIHRGIEELLDRLIHCGIEVNIETNGAVDISPFLKKYGCENMFFTIDYKLPSSGVEDKMVLDNFTALRGKDVIKFVVGSDEDTERMIGVMSWLKGHYEKMPHVFIGAVYGKIEPEKLVRTILDEPVLADARFQVQLHKIIWDSEKRGV